MVGISLCNAAIAGPLWAPLNPGELFTIENQLRTMKPAALSSYENIFLQVGIGEDQLNALASSTVCPEIIEGVPANSISESIASLPPEAQAFLRLSIINGETVANSVIQIHAPEVSAPHAELGLFPIPDYFLQEKQLMGNELRYFTPDDVISNLSAYVREIPTERQSAWAHSQILFNTVGFDEVSSQFHANVWLVQSKSIVKEVDWSWTPSNDHSINEVIEAKLLPLMQETRTSGFSFPQLNINSASLGNVANRVTDALKIGATTVKTAVQEMPKLSTADYMSKGTALISKTKAFAGKSLLGAKLLYTMLKSGYRLEDIHALEPVYQNYLSHFSDHRLADRFFIKHVSLRLTAADVEPVVGIYERFAANPEVTDPALYTERWMASDRSAEAYEVIIQLRPEAATITSTISSIGTYAAPVVEQAKEKLTQAGNVAKDLMKDPMESARQAGTNLLNKWKSFRGQ